MEGFEVGDRVLVLAGRHRNSEGLVKEIVEDGAAAVVIPIGRIGEDYVAPVADLEVLERDPRMQAGIRAAVAAERGEGDAAKAWEDRMARMFAPGTTVRIIDGPFSGFTGEIEALDLKAERLKVNVVVFGRKTPIQVDLSQVEDP